MDGLEADSSDSTQVYFNSCVDMKISSAVAILATGLSPSVVSAIWIYPLISWLPIDLTLPGASYRRRDLSEVADSSPEALSERASTINLYKACTTLNMASKYKNYPINGYLYGGAVLGRGSASASAGNPDGSFAGACAGNDPDCGFQGNLFIEQAYPATTAYDCCVQAQMLNDSAFFFFSSNAPAVFPQQCTIVRTSYCTQARYSTIIGSVAYNASAPRGTSYYNYVGNGRCGPGITSAISLDTEPICAAAAASANGGTYAEAGAAAAACAYTSPNVADQGGATPAG